MALYYIDHSVIQINENIANKWSLMYGYRVYNAVQSQKTVYALFESKQILPFGIAEQHTLRPLGPKGFICHSLELQREPFRSEGTKQQLALMVENVFFFFFSSFFFFILLLRLLLLLLLITLFKIIASVNYF